jgi:Concanavalin A-like lectin/glucanases superfamily
MRLNRMVVLVGLGALLVSACSHPSPDHPACGPNGECPGGLICSTQLICEEEGSPRDAKAEVVDSSDGAPPSRTRAGLVGLWGFDEASGTTIADTGDGTPKVPLTVSVGTVMFSASTMTPNGVAVIASAPYPHCTAEVVLASAVTLEAWVMASAGDQGTVTAPVVVAGLSSSINARDISIMQAGKRWLARVRTTADVNGKPDLLSTTDVTPGVMTHLVVVADATQRILYVDGKADAIDPAPGPLLNWDASYRMLLGDELAQNRQWAGTFALVAMYKQALPSTLVMMNHAAGPNAQ